ncbi:MAG: glycosyltransferase [Flavobacteriales bacterium]|nr:glycosyltransferase [Flavobacteriales bacterium]
MRILFISYWSVNEPLTDSTILPYLRIMSGIPSIERVTLVTVERDRRGNARDLGIPKVHHLPLRMYGARFGALSRIEFFMRSTVQLVREVHRGKYDLINAKAAIAAGMAHLVHRLTGVPYMVESYEPHSEYMLGSGVWSANGPYYRIARYFGEAEKHHARLLVTVTQNHRSKLIEEGVPPERLQVIPSIVDTERFAYDAADRARIREEQGWDESLRVGIYVGKFGGLYYDDEAFAVFDQAFSLFGARFRLVIISIDPADRIRSRLQRSGIPSDRAVVRAVPHRDVPMWLSAADLAFSTIRQIPAGLYQSPVKNGEYWANGLPILLTDKVSDDHWIIRERPWAGAICDMTDPGAVKRALIHMRELVEQGVARQEIMDLAREFRSLDIARRVYAEIFSGAEASGAGSK